MSAGDLAAIRLMARFHDLVANAGRMPRLAALAMGDAPFQRMLALSAFLFEHFGRGHAIALEALFEGVLAWLRQDPQFDEDALQEAALADYRACGARGRLSFMDRGLTVGHATAGATPPRQARHLHVGG